MKRPTITIIIICALLALHPTQAAFAQDTGRAKTDRDRKISISLGIPDSLDFHGHAGVGVGIFPGYEGSQQSYGAVALPLVDIRQPGFLFLKGASVNPNDGLASVGWNALNFSYSKGSEQKLRFSLGPLVRYSIGRDEGNSDALNGLGDINGSIGLGGFFEASAGPWSADVTVAPQDAGNGDDGVLVAFGTQYTAKVNDKLVISPGIFSSWGNDGYMQGFFGITSSQATQSGLTRFDADAGFKDVGAQIRTSYTLSKNWRIEGQVGYQHLLNAASDSPLVNDKNSAHSLRTLIGVAYQF